MKAEDTVMKSSMKFSDQGVKDAMQRVLERQAEATWKIAEQAGIREVVEWINKEGQRLEMENIYQISFWKDAWQAQLKEWGIKSHENAQD